MKFLTDQDVYAATTRFLIGLGHDVMTAAQLGSAQAEDAVLLRTAQDQGRIYLRLSIATQNAVHAELERVLTVQSEQVLQSSFVVVEPARHRIRNPPPKNGASGTP